MVIHKMIELEQHRVKLEILPTLREEDGLAMSSRNMRLSDDERKKAVHIIKTLTWIKQNLQPGNTHSVKQEAQNYLNSNGFKTDYIEIADATTLLPVTQWDGQQKTVALAAAYLSEIRLIDNLLLN
jgi:pantoate--beta-alanine ligase